MSQPASEPTGDPLKSKYAALRADLDQATGGHQPGATLAAACEALAEDGWRLRRRFEPTSGHGDAQALCSHLRKCLDVAAALAVQCMTAAVAYDYDGDVGHGRHRFQVEEAGKSLVLILDDAFLRRDLLESQAGVYVETLIRHLRAAAGAGQALRVRTGCVERVTSPAVAAAAAETGLERPD